MKVQLKNTSLSSLNTDLLVVPVAPGAAANKKGAKTKASSGLAAFDASSAALLRSVEKRGGAIVRRLLSSQEPRPAFGKRGELLLDAKETGLGAVRVSGLSALDLKKDTAADEWRRLGADAFNAAKRLQAKSAAIVLTHVKKADLERVVESIAEGARLADYEFLAFKGKAKKPPRGAAKPQLTLLIEGSPAKSLQDAIARALLAADCVCFARDLVNTPPSDMNPTVLVRHARSVRGVKMRVYDKRALTKMKAFALLGVSRGSDIPPAMIHMSYTPPGRSPGRKVITLIGKGVTFDSGGLSLKPGKGMEDMKCDMAGAACVLGVMRALAALPKSARIKHEVHVLIPTTENMVNGNALKPGDVIVAMNGKTIEVLNTDAEGRLILADALSYASRLKSNMIIDLATLTGACVVALGSDYAGMFSTDRELGLKLQASFTAGGERVWPLPLAGEYRAQMDSDVADMRNIGTGGPGAILGALFLKEFVPEGVPWVHLDIAGPAFVTKGNEYIRRGGTGFGVLPLLKFLGSV